jgi:hypothetical protein
LITVRSAAGAGEGPDTACNRLNGWHNEDLNAVPGRPDDGDAALVALTDVHLVRVMIDPPS